MIINGTDLLTLITQKDFLENYDLNNISAASYDVTLSNTILKLNETKDVVCLDNKEQIDALYSQIDITDGYELKPNECVLCTIKEKINMPSHLSGHIRARTSISRLGILTPFQHINPGYKGVLNIVLQNSSPNTYKLVPGLKIAQLVVEEITNGLSEELVYGNTKGSYQDENGVVGSQVYKDCIGKVFRHFKGNYYYIEGVSMDSETKEWYFVYRPLYNRKDSMVWTRSIKMFFEDVDPNRKDNLFGQKHRFELCTELMKDYLKKE